MNNYFVLINNQQEGPFDEQQLANLVQKGQLNQQTSVWTEGMPKWEVAGNVKELSTFFYTNATPPPLPLLNNNGVNQTTVSEKRPNTKLGTVKKCPSCGQSILSGAAVCPECGYAFHTGQKDDTLILLQKALIEIDNKFTQKEKEEEAYYKDLLKSDDKKLRRLARDETETPLYGFPYYIDKLRKQKAEEKLNRIKSTVIGNSRGELLAALAFSQPKSNRFGSTKGWLGVEVYEKESDTFKSEDLSFGYWTLFENSIQMAQISFSYDEAFRPFYDFYSRSNDPNTFRHLYTNIKASNFNYNTNEFKKKSPLWIRILLFPFRLIWWIIRLILTIITFGSI